MVLNAQPAEAGPLLSATYTQSAYGGLVVRPAIGATGSFDGSRFTLDAGNAFAGTGCVGAVPGCSPINTVFVAPISRLDLVIGANGPLSGTTGQFSIPATSGIHGSVYVRGHIAKMPFTFLTIPLNAGATSAVMRPITPSLTSFVVTVFGDAWHLGPITATGQTVQFQSRPDVFFYGDASVTAAGATRVNLVSLTRVKVRGLTANYLAFPSFLQLSYAPEPNATVLLGAASLWAAALGSRRARAKR